MAANVGVRGHAFADTVPEHIVESGDRVVVANTGPVLEVLVLGGERGGQGEDSEKSGLEDVHPPILAASC